MEPVLSADRFDVFRITCDRTMQGAMPRDVYLAFFRDRDVPRPICTVTVWPAVPGWDSDDTHCETKGNYVEWCDVADEYRREGIATEVLLAIQEFVGPLYGCGFTEAGEALMEAIGDKLTGAPQVFRDDWLARQGYDAEQRAEIHRECKLELSQRGFNANFRGIFQRYEPNTSARNIKDWHDSDDADEEDRDD